MNHINEFMNVKINIIEDSKIRKASKKKAINKKSLTGCVNCGDFCTGPPLPGMCMGILKKKLSKFVSAVFASLKKIFWGEMLTWD